MGQSKPKHKPMKYAKTFILASVAIAGLAQAKKRGGGRGGGRGGAGPDCPEVCDYYRTCNDELDQLYDKASLDTAIQDSVDQIFGDGTTFTTVGDLKCDLEARYWYLFDPLDFELATGAIQSCDVLVDDLLAVTTECS